MSRLQTLLSISTCAATLGFRQSPDPREPVAIAFISLTNPDRDSAVTMAAMAQAAECLRGLLRRYVAYIHRRARQTPKTSVAP